MITAAKNSLVQRWSGNIRLTWLAFLSGCVLFGMASSLTAPGKLALLVLIGLAAGTTFLWPETSTLLGVFALYSNLTVLAFRLHGAPRSLAFSFLVLFGLPLIYHVFYKGRPIIIDRTLKLMLVFLGLVLASTVFSKDPALALEWITIYATQGVVTYFLLVNIIRSRAAFERVVTVLLCTGALLGALSLYQEVSGDFDNQFFGLAQRSFVEDPAELIRTPDYVRRSHRAGGPMREPNYYAQILIVLFPFALYRIREEKGFQWLAAVLLASSILAGALLTYSRGGFLALMLISVVALRWKMLRLRVAVAGVAAGLLFVSLTAPGYLPRILSLTAVSSLWGDEQEGPDGAIAGRATEMLSAAAVFLDHPILGVGPGHYSPYYSVEYQTADSSRAFRLIERTRRAHSLYLEMAAELGLIGLMVFLVMVGMVVLTLARLRRIFVFREPRMANLLAAGTLSLLGLLGTALFLQLSYQRYFWFILAIAAALERIARVELHAEALSPDREDAELTAITDLAPGALPVSQPEALLLPEKG